VPARVSARSQRSAREALPRRGPRALRRGRREKDLAEDPAPFGDTVVERALRARLPRDRAERRALRAGAVRLRARARRAALRPRAHRLRRRGDLRERRAARGARGRLDDPRPRPRGRIGVPSRDRGRRSGLRSAPRTRIESFRAREDRSPARSRALRAPRPAHGAGSGNRGRAPLLDERRRSVRFREGSLGGRFPRSRRGRGPDRRAPRRPDARDRGPFSGCRGRHRTPARRRRQSGCRIRSRHPIKRRFPITISCPSGGDPAPREILSAAPTLPPLVSAPTPRTRR